MSAATGLEPGRVKGSANRVGFLFRQPVRHIDM